MVGSICGIQESLYSADNGADSCATDKEGHTAAGLGKKYGMATSRNIFRPGLVAKKE
jgi:hypothetical protein